MIYPRLTSETRRWRAACALRRWRKLRDENNAIAARLDNTTDPYRSMRSSLLASNRYFQGKADGYREALEDLFGI